MSEVVTHSPQAPQISLELDSAELAETYDRASLPQFTHGKALIELLGLVSGQRVLDVGCGTGKLGEYVAGLVAPDGEVVGIDPLPLRVTLASRKHPRLRASVGRAEDLSQFGDATFDAVYSNSVFHWVDDKPRALSEALRVLKPGGRIAINSADSDRPHQSVTLVRDAAVEAGLKQASAFGGLNQQLRVNEAELGRLLREAGFDQVSVRPHTITDDIANADELLAWSNSSSFGNFLSEIAPSDQRRVRDLLQQKLEARRTAAGIKLERYLVFASAQKR